MDRKKVTAYAAIIGILILIWLLLGRSKSAAIVVKEAAPDVGPYYLSYNYPQTNLPMFNNAGGTVASQSTGDDLPTCGCMNISQSFFKSSNELTDYFNSQLKDLADIYFKNVVDTLPDWFGQYINNTSGQALSNASQQALQFV